MAAVRLQGRLKYRPLCILAGQRTTGLHLQRVVHPRRGLSVPRETAAAAGMVYLQRRPSPGAAAAEED